MHITHPYSALAKIYDQMMDHVDYQGWAIYLSDIFDHMQIKVDSILDVSCGTGELVRFLSNMKYKLIASDISLEMLKVFKSKKDMRKTSSFTANSGHLPLGKERVDAVLMLYDSINYITDRNDLSRTFKEMFRILKPDGLLIFDTVTRHHCMTYFNREIEKQFWENDGYTRTSRFDAHENIQYTEFDVFLSDQKYHENHVQRIYELDELANLLVKEHFKIVATFDEFTFNQASNHSERIHFVCRKL